MKKTIKYLDNDGNYQYATVKDAGDLDKLKTKAKEDLVSAINELATNGIGSGGVEEVKDRIDQIQKLVDENSKNLGMNDQERQEMQQELQRTTQELNQQITEMQAEAAEQTQKLNDASAELKKKADAIDVQRMQQENAEALKNSNEALKNSLDATNEDLQKTADHLNEMEIQAGVVETSVKELQNGFESRVSSADFNEARNKLQEQETLVRQLNNELTTKASNKELDMVTQRVQNAESNIAQNAQGIKAAVTKETIYKEMDDFSKYRENRLKYSRDFSNNWGLNGNDILDDDHLFDVQHDVKSVSIRNGAYLTQTTDLNVDDMSKTFTMAMWVKKGKKPRVWYGSNELTNMKVKEDKGDYQRVYWTFSPTIVKQDIRIAGDSTTQGNLIISEPKLEQSDRPSAWSTNTGDQYATTEKLAHDLKLTSDKLESTITKQSEFSDRQLQDESRITQTEHGLEVANKTIVSKTDGLRQEFDGKMDATSKSLTTEYQSFTNRAIGQMADGGSNLILNSSFGNLKNSYDKWTNVSPKVRIVEDDNGLKWAKMEQSGLTANSPIGLTSNLFRVKKGIVTVALDIRTDNAEAIDNDNIVTLESYNADQKRVFIQEVGFDAFKITKETLSDHGPHRVTYKYNQTRDDTQYMAVHIVLPKNGVLYVTNVLARTVANGEDSGEYAPNAADLHEQVVQQRTRIEQNDQAIALKADQTQVDKDISQAKAELTVRADGIAQNVANLTKSQDAVAQRVTNVETKADGIKASVTSVTNDLKNGRGSIKEGVLSMTDDHFSTKFSNIDNKIDGVVSKQAEFQNSIDGVKSTVSTLNNNQASFTKFEQTDGGFKLVAGKQTLEFGGTNLLKNSDFQQGWTNWSSHGSSSSISDSRPSGLPNYVKTIDFLSNTGSSQSALVQSHIGVKAGKDYMISFWAIADAATELCVESNAIRYQPKLTTSWQYYSGKVTFQTDDRALYIYPTSKTTWVHLAGIKLEQGNVATAWSPELVDKTTNLQTQITATNQALESKVGKGEVFSAIKQTPDAIILTANDIELKSKTALKVGKITGKDLSIDLSNGAVDFKHGHIRGNLIDIDIDNNSISGGVIKGTSIVSNVTQQTLANANDIPQTSSEKAQGRAVYQVNEFGQVYNGNVAINMGYDSAIGMDGNDIGHPSETAIVSFRINSPETTPANKISDHVYVNKDTWADSDIGNHFNDYTTLGYSTPDDKYTLIPIGVIKNYRFSFGFSLRLKAYLRGGNSTTATMVVWDANARNRLTVDGNYRVSKMSGDEIGSDEQYNTLIKSDITHYIGGAYSEFTSSIGYTGLEGKTVGIGLLVKMKTDVALGICPISFSANMLYKKGQNVSSGIENAQYLMIDNFGNLDLSDRNGRFISMGSGSIKISNRSSSNNITTIDGDGIRFNSSVTPQQKRIKFGGNWNNGGTDGIALDSHGNIWADSDSWAWKIRDKNGNLAFQVPLISNGQSTGNSKFFAQSERFFFQTETKDVYSPLAISWTSFGDIDNNRKYPVVALGSFWTDEYGVDMNNWGGVNHNSDAASGIAFCSGKLVAFTKWKHAVLWRG